MPPPRKPTVLKRRDGVTKVERYRPGEPVVEEGAPPRPADLDPDERRVWDETVADLLAQHVLSPVDGIMLRLLVVTKVRWMRTVAFLKKRGTSYRAKNTLHHRPEFIQERQLAQDLRIIAGRFGLSPADRAGVEAIPDRSPGATSEFWTTRSPPGDPRRRRAPPDPEAARRRGEFYS